jgi:hypothetical protein
VLSESDAIAQAAVLKNYHEGERSELDLIRRYWKGLQRFPGVIPSGTPREVRELARISRVNVCSIIVDSLAQATFVDNFRSSDETEDNEVWKIWQKNKLDARQAGVHRAAFAYGTSYTVVMPGDPVPVIRGCSPRQMTAVYGDDPDWPVYALEYRGKGVPGTPGSDGREWRLYDKTHVYELEGNRRESKFNFVAAKEHGAGVCPVVRFLDIDDLDADDEVDPERSTYGARPVPTRGQIGPVMALQDQIDLSTFDLKVAEHYAAFRQRWVVGWLAEDEAEHLKASAAQLWTFKDGPEEIKLGEFSQTDLEGYLDSRKESLKHAATLSQTPVHELIGDLVNLSAEALVAAEQGHERKVDERKTMLGESWEQTLRLAASLKKIQVPDNAEVVWRDTSARAYSATIDALGKLAKMLGVPPQELWAKIPGVTKQDVDRWKAEAQQGDAFAQLQAILDKQTQPPAPANAGA